jgi:hypothetical protein
MLDRSVLNVPPGRGPAGVLPAPMWEIIVFESQPPRGVWNVVERGATGDRSWGEMASYDLAPNRSPCPN